MLSRTAIRVVVSLALLLLLGAIPGLNGWFGLRLARSQVTKPQVPKAAPKGGSPKVAPKVAPEAPKAAPKGGSESPKAAPSGLSEVEKAILALDEEYVSAFNKGDSYAVAAMYTEDAEVVEATGDRYQGRNLIERRFADVFAASPGLRIAIETDSIRSLLPDAVKEEGRTLVTPTKGSPVETFFTVLYMKRDDRWQIASVREDPVTAVSPHERLKDLEWMIGDWVEERPEATVRLNCQWSDDKNFLIRSISVKNQGKPVMSISQRIGWDPLTRQIRSWEFDSLGGFGEGRWRQDGGRWVIRHTGVHQDGTTASSTNIMSNDRPDLVRWVSTSRVVGDESLPDTEANVLVRVPPPPAVQQSKVQATPPSTPAKKGSPR